MLLVWAVSAAPAETMYAILPRSGAIAEVDVGQRQVTRILPVAPVADPRFGVVSPDGASLYLGSSEGVSVIDTSSNKVSRLIPLLREPAGSWFLGPIALSPDGAFLYVTTLGTHQSDHKDTLTVIDTATFETVSVIPLGFRPSDMAVTRDGAVYVALDASYAVWRIDPAAREVIARIRVRRAPLHLAASPDGASLYVLTDLPPSLEVISTASDSIVASVAMDGGAPQDVAVTPDGREVLVTATGGRMKVVGAATMEVPGDIVVSNDLIGQVLVTANGRFAYVGSSDIVEGRQVLQAKVVDLVERQVVAALPLRQYPRLLAMNPVLDRAYIAEPQGGAVSIIDTVTHAMIGEIPQPTLYGKPVISPAGEAIYFASYDALGNSILVLDTASKSFSDAIPVADAFQNFHADRTGTHLYAVGKMITVIDASTQSVVARGELPEHDTSTLTEDGTTLYTVGARSLPDLPYCLQQSLYATDTTALTTTEFPLPGGGHALDLTVTPDGQRVYVSRIPRNIPDSCYAHPTSEFCDCPPFRAIVMVDVKQQTATELIGISSGILAMHPGGRTLYVGTESQAIQVVDTDSNHLVDSIPVLFYVDYLEFDSNGLHLYAGSSYVPFITIIDTLSNEIVDTICVGAGVAEVAIAPQSHAGCFGDCNRDDIVDVAEVLLGINVVLGIIPLSVCDSLSPDGQTPPTVDRVVLAVDNALNGCRRGSVGGANIDDQSLLRLGAQSEERSISCFVSS